MLNSFSNFCTNVNLRCRAIHERDQTLNLKS